MAKFSISKDAKELSIPIDKPRTLDHSEESNNLNKETLYPQTVRNVLVLSQIKGTSTNLW